MLNKRVTIPYATLNNSYSGSVIEIDPSMEFTSNPITGEVTKTVYPIGIQIINDTGAEIEYNAVTSVEEYNMYSDTNPPVLQRLQKSGTLTTDYTNFPKCYKFLIKAREATASSDLIIEFINYRYQ